MGIFEGDKEQLASHQRVGWMLSNCAWLEGELAYLNWQLFAFDWDKSNPKATVAERQHALNEERAKEEWQRDTPLAKRLRKTTAAFNAKSVTGEITSKPEIKKLKEQWSELSAKIEPLVQKRNDYCHSSLQWRDGKLEREFGKLWGGTFATSEADENALIKAFADLAIEVGELATALGFLLPFADRNMRISASTG